MPVAIYGTAHRGCMRRMANIAMPEQLRVFWSTASNATLRDWLFTPMTVSTERLGQVAARMNMGYTHFVVQTMYGSLESLGHLSTRDSLPGFAQVPTKRRNGFRLESKSSLKSESFWLRG
jgi:hypothetical protein